MKNKKLRKNKLGWKWLLIIIIGLFFGAVGSIIADRFLLPYLVSLPYFEKYEFLKPKERQIVVQREKTITIKEENVTPEIARKIGPTIVNISLTSDLGQMVLLSKIKSGKGIVLTSDGLILTTKSVVKNIKASYTVFTADGKNYSVKKIISDPATDFVFIKIQANDLPAAELGVSEELKLGQKVIILANFLGNSQISVKSGIVSNLKKEVISEPIGEILNNYLEIDTEADSKYLGSPVVDFSGKIIGLLNSISEENKEVLALPVDYVKGPFSQVVKNNKIERPYLGIKYISITPDYAYLNNLSRTKGILLPSGYKSVIQNSPAAKAGLRPGDLIYAIDGKEISNIKTFFQIFQEYNPGDEIEIAYQRGGKELKTKTRIETMSNK